jgi:nitrogen fixation NifU-like protein
MNDELQAVYRERVLDHSKNPRNCYRPQAPDREAVGFNPLCGDKLTVYLQMDGDVVHEVAFEGTGCAISIASASMMTNALAGCSISEADRLIESAQQMLNEEPSSPDESLEEFRALEGVRAYPSRVKCATLAWSAAEAALHQPGNNVEQVSTE